MSSAFGVRARPRSAARALCLGVIASLGAVAPAAYAQTFTGAEVKLAVDPSIDIMKDHVSFLALQDRYDAMLGYLVMTERFAPLRYVADDGTKSARVGHRAATMIGGGWGTPHLGFMVGAWTDVIKMGPVSDMQFQGILFGGVALFGVQATYSKFEGARLNDVDPYGNFGSPKGGSDGYSYQPGAGQAQDGAGKVTDAFTLYHSSGASLVVLRDVPSMGSVKVTEVRAQLQPLAHWLDNRFGLPMIAVQKRDAARALAGDRSDAAQALTRPDALPKDPWEVEVGSDDLLEQGIRAHLVGRVSPEVKFGSAELGAYRDIENLTVAARTFAFARDDRPQLSLDAFARYSIVPPGKESLGFPFAVAASYSFNSPDSTTFVPLPYAHVFGLQIIVGAPDLAKPVVPIVRPKKTPDDAGGRRGAR